MMETMLDYIQEEKPVLKSILANKEKNLGPFIKEIKGKSIKRILFLATGSSFNSVLCAKLYMEEVANITLDIEEPYTFYEYGKVPADIDLIIAVSQRGTSTSTINAVKKAKESSVPVFILTSIMDSPITKLVDTSLDMGCGIETVGYSTKGVSATIMSLMMMAIELGVSSNHLSIDDVNQEYTKLDKLVDEIPNIIHKTEKFYQENKQDLDDVSRITPLGYGPNVGTVREAETKFTETVRVPTQGLEIEAYMHGPIFELHKDSTLIFTEVENSKPYDRSRKLNDFVSKYCDHVYTITNGTSNQKNILGLEIEVDEFMSPLALVVPYQLLSYLISKGKGIDLSIPVYSDFKEVMRSKVE
ncbi:SIS domain-containing protein [Lederbergia sp. NSJ-179]|uniref:SIS domain-containing protein n=1 Tax=Lederbergia sp. NSJ-179 TaxID=2931402 RepID=UPI001FD0C9C5|nr:SIS domain-containing protein [Lederbergia sp. NSJ-179]MCJ7843253.1 SIS domain-containing protein [Lederbergia sp. NSJ-179]